MKVKNKEKVKSISKYYFECFSYLKESKKFIYASIILFIVFSYIGFLLSDQLVFLNKILKDLIGQTQGLGAFQLVIFILKNNILASFFGMVSGFVLGIFPFISILNNGIILGYVGSLVYSTSGGFDLLRLIPHGIFELPAIFISLGLGMRLGFFFVAKKKLVELKRRLLLSLNTFLLIVIPLLIIAAIIEGVLIAISG